MAKAAKKTGTEKGELDTWRKRWSAAEGVREEWEKENRTHECYNYWRGDQLVNAQDEFGIRKAQVNKIHPEVRNQIPSLYFYRPFARIIPKPEMADTPGTSLSEQTQLLQDTTNHLIRQERVRFRPSTFLALKESFWAIGIVEVGYSASFTDDPGAERPALRENEDTDIGKNEGKVKLKPEEMSEEDIEAEIQKLQSNLSDEQFYVKHIPANQIMVSCSDKPILEDNDWVGYWEDVPLSDVKKAGKQGVYENTDKLEAVGAGGDSDEERQTAARERYEKNKSKGEVDSVRIYKVWDLRNKT